MSSDEEQEYCEMGTVGYQWEPEYTESELAEISDDSLETENEHERSYNLSWCTCDACVIMQTLKESKCCKEFDHYCENYLLDISCITQHEEFNLLCLTEVVLETDYIAFLRYKRFAGRSQDSLTNIQKSLMAYRQFICWVRREQPLRKKKRLIIPACVVNKIRNTFPDPSDTYEGYHSASSERDTD